MNNLDFINNLIKHNEAQLAKYPLSGKLLDPNYKHKEADIIYKHNKYYTEQLQTLYKIKTELEAWKEIKKYINLKESRVALYDSIYEYIELENDCIDESNSEEEGISIMIIKKALEVEDEG